MPAGTIRLGIVDAHFLFRELLRNYLSEQNGMQVTILAQDMEELQNKLKTASIDVLITDLFIPRMNVFDGLKTIAAEFPELKILVLSICTDISLISNLLDLGISGFIHKGDDPRALLEAISEISADKIYRNSYFTEALYWSNQSNRGKIESKPSTVWLSDREKRILVLLWEEKSTKEIADQLFLSVKSVEKIRHDMKEKLGIKSTVGLFKYAIDKKIILTSHSDQEGFQHGRILI
jgi:DNA-binding NarL/FixJ family response regulator